MTTFEPKPVTLVQVDAEDYSGAGEPQPVVVVGPLPGVVVPAPPETGDYTLTAVDGELTWVEVEAG